MLLRSGRLAIFLGLGLGFLLGARAQDLKVARGVVQQVVDGDTLIVLQSEGSRAEVVRLLGVDAPEDFHPDAPRRKWSQAAKQALEKLVLGRQVSLEFAPYSERDRYGRLLAYVRRDDGVRANEAMIAYGYALHFELYRHPRFDRFEALEARARREGKGVFRKQAAPPAPALSQARSSPGEDSSKAPASPPESAQEAPQEPVGFMVSITQKIHRQDCPSQYVIRDKEAGKMELFDSYQEALKAGLNHCRRCKPYRK